jgi:hypothetical protein
LEAADGTPALTVQTWPGTARSAPTTVATGVATIALRRVRIPAAERTRAAGSVLSSPNWIATFASKGRIGFGLQIDTTARDARPHPDSRPQTELHRVSSVVRHNGIDHLVMPIDQLTQYEGEVSQPLRQHGESGIFRAMLVLQQRKEKIMTRQRQQ